MRIVLKNKDKIRKEALFFRKKMAFKNKLLFDKLILENLYKIDEFRNSQTILTYVSKESEINTLPVIIDALENGKKVAVPKCLNDTEMQFYYIDSIDQLEKGNFSVLEPKENLDVVDNFDGAFMVVPSLAVDMLGYRVGYGKGFFDRYLAKHKLTTAVLCYHSFLYLKLLCNRLDYRCNFVVTDKCIIKGKGYKYG